MKSRLVKFLIIFAVVLGGAEGFVRLNGRHFYALSDKLLLEEELLRRSPETEILFIGTSRFLDAIDESIFSEALGQELGRNIKSLNAATTGCNGARFAYLARVATENKNLTHVILEASSPAMQDGELNLPKRNTVPAEEESKTGNDDVPIRKEVFADTFENGLQDWVTDHIALVKYRKSLRPGLFFKLFVIQTAKKIDPNQWSRKGILRNFFVSDDFEVADDFRSNFQPDVITPTTIQTLPTKEELRPNHVYENLEAISQIFADSGLEVIWVAPPVTEEKRKSNFSLKFTGYYQAIAFQFGTNFYDYAGSDLDDEFFRDPSHLNKKGRALFSTVLAEKLAADHFPEATNDAL